MPIFKWFSRSLLHQISILLVLIIFTVLLIFAFYFYNIQSQSLQQSTKQMARQLISSLSSANAKNLHFNDNFAAWIDIKNQVINNRQQIEREGLFKIDEIALLDKNGATFAHSSPADYPLQKKYTGDLPENNTLASATDNILFNWDRDKGLEAVRIYADIKFQRRSVGTLILQLDLSLLMAQQHALVMNFAQYFLLVLLIAIGIGLAFGRWISSPAALIEASLPQLGSGNLQLAELHKRNDEYKRLAVAIEQADKNLHNSQDQIHLLLDSTAEAIYGIDTEGNCTFVNQACLDMLGYKDTAEFLGKNVHELIHHSYQDGSPYPIERCHIYRAFKEQRDTHIDDEVLWRKDGSRFAAEYWSHPVFKNGACVGAVVTFLDITERLDTQRALLEREQGLALTLDSIGDAVIVTDIEGHITRMNPIATELTGWQSNEACGRHLPQVFKIINAETRETVADPVEKVLRTGKVVDLANHTVLISKNNIEYQIADSAAPINDKNGEILGVILVFRDVTQQYHNEEILRRSQKMDAIGQLSGGIAHDFNNQLGVIIGYLDFLQIYTADDEKPNNWVQTASRATLRCMDLTRQLLTFSRRQGKEKSVVNLNATLNELKNMVSRSVTPEVDVQYTLAENLWLTEIDPGEFQDAILNLVINARDAMPNGGKLLIETSNTTLEADYAALNPGLEAGDYVQLLVSDTGTGMDKETQDHVFEPFFSTKPAGQGTGLGMAMVYGFVKRYGGHIGIYSEPAVGTTIRLYLPYSSASESTDINNEQYVDLPGGNESILIVDDEFDLLQLAERYLSDLGYRTRTAENAAQALEILAGEQQFDLLFSDVVMPGGMNGYELAQQATEYKPELKVLLTSGFTSKTVAHNGLDQFTTRILNKPYRKAELAMRIRSTLEQAAS